MENFVADAIFIDAPADRVFAALLDPEEVLVWMEAEAATIEPRPGGAFAVARADGSRVAGTISVLEPGSLLEIGTYRHQAGAEQHGPMVVSFRLQPHDGGVWVTVRQADLDTGPAWQQFAQATRKEWVRATVALKRCIEQI